jgi:hypothetical protein
MDFELLQREFNLRYYRWALQDSRREIENDFPFVGGFKSGPTWHVKDMMAKMPLNNRLFFGAALVKRFHKEAVEAAGDQITEAETKQCDEYLRRALYPSSAGFALERRLRAGERAVYANRTTLARLVKLELKSVGLRPFESENVAGVLSYQSTIDGWQIITQVHTREKHAQLAYNHIIWSVEKVRPVTLGNGRQELWPVQLHNWISFTGWLGISSRTEWTDLLDSDSPQAAKELAALCQHFLRVAPELLAGLSV